MTTAIDSNVVAALLDRADSLNTTAKHALSAARTQGRLLISAPVYAELLASPTFTPQLLEEFLRHTSIEVDWHLSESMWRAAGDAFRSYAERRRKQSGGRPRRILADFLIGAHAAQNRFRLLSLDEGLYRAAFPRLDMWTI